MSFSKIKSKKKYMAYLYLQGKSRHLKYNFNISLKQIHSTDLFLEKMIDDVEKLSIRLVK